MIKMYEIRTRPVLPDKLQLHISPGFLSIFDETELFYDGHVSPFFEKDIQKLYSAKITFFNGVKKGNRPYFQLPNDFNIDTSEYIWNTRVCLRKPFTVVIDFNFIRNILNIIKDDPKSGYDQKYHESIQLHDNNFIDNNKIWANWDDILIQDMGLNLKDKALQFADDTFRYLVEDHDLLYSLVSLKHAEFNIDYYVGSDKSLPLILAFQRFIYSDRGQQWRSEIESIGMVHHSKNSDFDKTIINQDGHDGHTFKFYISKGLSLKIYQKSDDHIRAEFVYDGSFIQQRFHKYTFDVVYPKLFEFSKELFQTINFEGILYLLSKEITEDKNDTERKILDVLERYDSELLHVVNNIVLEQPISDPKTVRKITGDPKLRSLFSSELTDTGHRAYSYNPHKREKRFKRLKPPAKKQPKPKYCECCHSYYHTDQLRCPYCEKKNPDHDLSMDTGFLDFMKKVNDYKDGGYRGF